MNKDEVDSHIAAALEKTKLECSDLDKAKFLWAEYEYRHDHCWNTLFKLTAAVVVLSIIPYTHRSVVEELGYLVAASPLLAMALLWFSFARLSREVEILRKIRVSYRVLQDRLFTDISHSVSDSSFDIHVRLYLLAMTLITFGNFLVVITFWTPVVVLHCPPCLK